MSASESFAKVLSANDVGATGGHQAGICIPKKNNDLLKFFPRLDASLKNPDAWIFCHDENCKVWKLRYVYYNGKLHGSSTRNEYRITHLSSYLKKGNAQEDDTLVFSKTSQGKDYTIRLMKNTPATIKPNIPEPLSVAKPKGTPRRIVKLRGWRRIH
mgnify:FL=1